jgi:nucleoside triphosphate pyrophosphatase
MRLSQRLPRLVLASRSPRRRRLLSEHGLAHEAVQPSIDDARLHRGQASPAQWVAALAYLKAAAGADALGRSVREPVLVIGADTMCVRDDRLLGQPADAADAEAMLRSLENGAHEVLTGVALLRVEPDGSRSREVLVDRAWVRVGNIGPERIREYVASVEWQGKAGAYNLFERIDAGWPIEYSGDPTTVMGLPMRALVLRLERLAAAGARGQQSPDARG